MSFSVPKWTVRYGRTKPSGSVCGWNCFSESTRDWTVWISRRERTYRRDRRRGWERRGRRRRRIGRRRPRRGTPSRARWTALVRRWPGQRRSGAGASTVDTRSTGRGGGGGGWGGEIVAVGSGGVGWIGRPWLRERECACERGSERCESIVLDLCSSMLL